MAKSFDYTVKFQGDISQVEKVLKKQLTSEISKIENNAIVFKFDFQNGVKDLQNKLDLIAGQLDTNIGIQFRYEVNKKLKEQLEEELSLAKVSHSVADVKDLTAALSEIDDVMSRLVSQGADISYLENFGKSVGEMETRITDLENKVKSLNELLESSHSDSEYQDLVASLEMAQDQVEDLRNEVSRLNAELEESQNGNYYTGFGNGQHSYSWYDEYREAEEIIAKLKEEIESLRQTTQGGVFKEGFAFGIDQTALNRIADSLERITTAIGEVSEDRNLLSFLSEVNESLSNIFANLSEINIAGSNIVMNVDMGNNKNPQVEQFLRKQLEQYRQAYLKLFSPNVNAKLVKEQFSEIQSNMNSGMNLGDASQNIDGLDDRVVSLAKHIDVLNTSAEEFLDIFIKKFSSQLNPENVFSALLSDKNFAAFGGSVEELKSQFGFSEIMSLSSPEEQITAFIKFLKLIDDAIESRKNTIENDPFWKELAESNQRIKVSRNVSTFNNRLAKIENGENEKIKDQILGEKDEIDEQLDESIIDISTIIKQLSSIREILQSLLDDNYLVKMVDVAITRLDEFKSELNEGIAITKEDGSIQKLYRGVKDTKIGWETNKDDKETFWTTNKEEAEAYAGALGKVYEAEIKARKAIEIDAGGNSSESFLYLGDQRDEASQQITEAYNKQLKIQEKIQEIQSKIDSSSLMDKIPLIKELQQAKEELIEVEEIVNKISDDNSNPYTTTGGTHDIADYWLKQGFDTIIFKNIKTQVDEGVEYLGDSIVNKSSSQLNNLRILGDDLTEESDELQEVTISAEKFQQAKQELSQAEKELEIATESANSELKNESDSLENLNTEKAINETKELADETENLKEKTKENVQVQKEQEEAINNASSKNAEIAKRYESLSKQLKQYFELVQYSLTESFAQDPVAQSTFKNLKLNIDSALSGIDEFKINMDGTKGSIEKATQAAEDFSKTFKELFQSSRINFVDDIQKEFDKLKTNKRGFQYIPEYENDLNKLKSQIEELRKYPLDIVTDKEINDVAQLKNEIQNTLQRIKSETKNVDFIQIEGSKIKKELADLTAYISKNTKLPSSIKSQLRELQEDIERATQPDVSTTAHDFEILKSRIQELRYEAEKTGKMGRSFLDQIKQRLTDMNAKLLAQYFSIHDWIRYIRQMSQTVVELDSAITELRKVSNASDERLALSFDRSAQTAKELGDSITNVINVTADWSRLGYSVDDAEELARVTTLFKNVGDNMSADDASSYLISTLQGFQMTADQAEGIVDKFNEVANNYAIDTRGIGEALQRSAASFNAANTSLSGAIAVVTAANSVVQNPEQIGTAMKTLSARIRGSKVELEELGEAEEDVVNLTSKLRNEVKAMTGFDIMEDENTYKSIDEIIIGIGKHWKELTDIQQAALAEDLAGKRNSNVLISLLQNAELVEDIYKTAEKSAKSARKEQENYEKSIQYSIDRLKAVWQDIQSNLFKSDAVKSIVESAADGLEGLGKVAEGLSPIISGLIKILGKLFDILGELSDKTNGLGIIALLGGGAAINYKNKDSSSTIIKLIKALKDFKKTNKDSFESSGKSAVNYSAKILGADKDLKTLIKTSKLAKLAVAGIIVGAVVAVWDAFTTSVKEAKEELEVTKNKISELETEIESLESIGYRNSEQEERLKLLQQELEIQKEIAKQQEIQIANEKVKLNLASLTDKDAYGFNSVKYDAKAGYNSEKFSRDLADYLEDRDVIYNQVDQDAFDKYLNYRQEKRKQTLRNDISDLEQLVSEVYSQYREYQDIVDSGIYGENDPYLENAKNEAEAFRKQYIALNELLTQGQKAMGIYDYDKPINDIISEEEDLKDKLIELQEEGKISKSVLEKIFEDPVNNGYGLSEYLTEDIVNTLKEANVDAEQLYSWLMNIADPQKAWRDKTKSSAVDVLSQLTGSAALRGGTVEDVLRDVYGIDLNDENHLQAFLDIQLQFEGKDKTLSEWIKSIQDELNNADIEVPIDVEFAPKDLSEKVTSKLTSVESLYGKFYEDIKSGKKTRLDLDDVEGLRSSLVKSDENPLGVTEDQFEEFERVVSDGTHSIQEMQDAFDTLSTQFVDDALALEGYTEENEALIKSQLELAGYTKESVDRYVDFKRAIYECDQQFKVSEDGLHLDFANEQTRQEFLKNARDAINEMRAETQKQSQMYGNVDIYKRPIIDNHDGSYSTTSTANMTYDSKNGNGELINIHATPILPNGEVWTDEALDEYLGGIVEKATSNSDILERDKVENGGMGLIYQVDTTTMIDGKEEPITAENLENAIMEGNPIDEAIHDVQSKIYSDQAELTLAVNIVEEGGDLTIQQLLLVAQYAGLAKDELLEYYVTKLTADALTMSTAADCEQLANELEQLGINCTKLREYIALKSMAESVNVSGGNTAAYLAESRGKAALGETPTTANDALAQVQNSLNEKIKLVNDTTKEAAGGGGKEAGDAYVEAFENELKELDELRDAGVISEKEYLDRLKALYVKYFANRKEYLKQFKQYEKQYLEGMKSLYESAISGAITLLNDQIDELEKAKEDAVEALEEARKNETEPIQDRIDALEDERDAMQKANEQRERALNLQKAQYELERANSQRTRLIYKNGQMQYVQDYQEVRNAKENVEDTLFDMKIGELDDEIDDLNKQLDDINEKYDKLIEETEKFYDDQIKGLQDMIDMWEELQHQAELIEVYEALNALGISAEDILSGNLDVFNSVRDGYIGTLAGLHADTDAVAQAFGITTENAEALKNALLGYDEATQVFSNLKDDISGIADAATEAATAIGGGGGGVTGETAPTGEGTGSETPSGGESSGDSSSLSAAVDSIIEKEPEVQGFADKFANNEDSIKAQVEEASKAIADEDSDESYVNALVRAQEATEECVPEMTSLWGELLGTIAECIASVGSFIDRMQSAVGNATGLYLPGAFTGTAYARGNWSAKSKGVNGVALTGELGQELVVDSKTGRWYTVGDHGAEFAHIKPNDIIFNHQQTEELFKNGKIKSRGKSYASGNNNQFTSLTPEELSKYTKLDFTKDLAEKLDFGNQKLMNIDKTVSTISNNKTVNNNPVINVNNPTFTCTGVTGDEVIHQIEQSFAGLFTNAYQQSMIK